MSSDSETKRGSTQSGPHLIVGGFATLAFLLLAYLAFDDITTDNATSFPLEYTFLLACAVWGLFVAARLIRRGNHILGLISIFMLAGAVWGQRKVGPGTVPSWQLEYLATLAGMLWFLVLSAILVAMGFRFQRQAGGRA